MKVFSTLIASGMCRQAVTALAMNGLQLGDRQIRVSMAKAPARTVPEQRHGNDLMAINLIQAQAQARLMQLPAFNMLLPMSGVHTNSVVKVKRPHQDPDKVVRTVFVENVDDDMDEQVQSNISICTCALAPGTFATHLQVLCCVCIIRWCSVQGLAEYFSVCGEVTAVRLAGSKGSRKAWIEFGTKESARSAREYDNTVSSPSEIGGQDCTVQHISINNCAAAG